MQLSQKNKGSITVEAALIFPTIFLCILAVIFISMLIYQKAYVQSLADIAANQGAAAWNNPAKSLFTGEVAQKNLAAGGLYWRIYDSKKGEKLKNIDNFTDKNLDRFSVLKSTRNEVKADIQDYIAYKKLNVTVKATYEIPLGKLFILFGLNENFTITAKTAAVINEPAEFIRNTDFVLDSEKELESSNPGLAQIGDKLRSSITEIITKINKFFGESGGD